MSQTALVANRASAFETVPNMWPVEDVPNQGSPHPSTPPVGPSTPTTQGDPAVDGWRRKFANGFLGNDPCILDCLRVASRVAETDCTVLVNGESGTGKELMAQAIHRASSRAQGPFVTLNCAAIPRELVESELFGHARGAFTGATTSRVGRFEAADGGTLFLDEIGELEPAVQCKLLRVLQTKEFSPVGDSKTLRADVRIVAATNRDLEKMCEEGKFREDLYYRLNVVPIGLPPLRERKSDIVPLARDFMKRFSRHRGGHIIAFTEAAEHKLQEFAWPGNVRQLENLMERIAILHCGGAVDVKDLPETVRGAAPVATGGVLFGALQMPAEGVDLNAALEDCEVRLILQALDRTGGNKAQAAQLLRLNRTTLVEKLRKRNMLCGPSQANE